MVKRQPIIGVQSHKKKELEDFIKGTGRKDLKIIEVKRPDWWFGRWKKLYEVRRKSYHKKKKK